MSPAAEPDEEAPAPVDVTGGGRDRGETGDHPVDRTDQGRLPRAPRGRREPGQHCRAGREVGLQPRYVVGWLVADRESAALAEHLREDTHASRPSSPVN